MKTPLAQFRMVLGLSTLLMVVWSWPLWLEGTGAMFPRVPFLGFITRPPAILTWVRLLLFGAATLASCFGLFPRRTMGVAVILMLWMVVEDQFRLQPWVYQFMLMGMALATISDDQAMALCRLLLIGMYFHSGLSKLDYSFVHEMGPTFAQAFVRILGLTYDRFPSILQWGGIILMPAWEIAVSIGLVFNATRKKAVHAAIFLHVALLLILGPFGLNHSRIVLFWNFSLIFEVSLLFGAKNAVPTGPDFAASQRLVSEVRILFLLAVLLPFGEPWGLWDSWPSFALYSSHNERMICYQRDGMPPGFADPVKNRAQLSWEYRTLDLNYWSLEERRVPIYPQGRALNGVAEFLANRYFGLPDSRIIHQGRADRISGKRSEIKLHDLDDIRQHGDSYFLNSHPMP